MSTLKSNIQIQPADLFTSSATQATDLGALATTGDGRYFRYAKVGATALVPGMVYQGPASDATYLNVSGGLAVGQTKATGTSSFTISTSTSITADALNGALMSVAVTPGQGYTYKVKTNSATSSATGLTIYLEDPLLTNLTTATRVVFALNQYNGIVVLGSTPTASVVGVAVYPVAATYFGWIQTRGVGSVLIQGTPGSGNPVGANPLNITGSAAFATGVITFNPVGYMTATGTSGEYDLVDIRID
jgi:hypothetical protein